MDIKETGENQERQWRKRQKRGESRGDCVWESQEMKRLRGGRGSNRGVNAAPGSLKPEHTELPSYRDTGR